MITLSKSKRTGKDYSTFKPQLTSLVDVMTILLVFLIKSFSAEENLITPSRDMALAVSSSKTPTRPLISIRITKEYILSDDDTKIVEIASFNTSDSLVIPKLKEWLDEKQAGGRSSSELMIQSDKDITFEIIKKVMYTCSQAGKTDFTILVVQEG